MGFDNKKRRGVRLRPAARAFRFRGRIYGHSELCVTVSNTWYGTLARNVDTSYL